MIVILGLVILIAAVIAGVSGVLTNSGSAHAVGNFAVFGYHVTGSTGTLFLYGIVVGAVALAGLSMLLAGARRTSRRGREARNGLRASRRETVAVSQDRDDLIEQRDNARANMASDAAGNGNAGNGNAGNGNAGNGNAGNGSDPGHRGPGLVERLRARGPRTRPVVPRPTATSRTAEPGAISNGSAPADNQGAEVPAGASTSAE